MCFILCYIILSSHRLFFGVGNTLCPFHLSSLRDNYYLLREAHSAHFAYTICVSELFNKYINGLKRVNIGMAKRHGRDRGRHTMYTKHV